MVFSHDFVRAEAYTELNKWCLQILGKSLDETAPTQEFLDITLYDRIETDYDSAWNWELLDWEFTERWDDYGA